MKIIKVKDTNTANTPHNVDVRKLLSHEHGSFVHIELRPGEELKMHVTPVDAVFYILEGNGIVQIGKEIENVEKDQLIFSPAKIPHKLKNDSAQNFKFLVVKTPAPTEETKIL